MTESTSLYNAQISAGSLLLRESREIAKLLLENADNEQWHRAIVVDNILQKRSPASAKRMAKLIRNRLELMKPDLWKLVLEGNNEVASQALLAAAIKHSRLLGDFMQQVIPEHLKAFDKELSLKDWDNFLAECERRDSEPATWSESTRRKLGQVIFRILAEAKYIDNTRSLNLTPVKIVSDVKRYLAENNEDYILKSMEVYP